MRVLILGVGNILLRDEGVGVRLVEAMGDLSLPDGVELLDGGTSGVDLIDDVADRDKVIVVDSVCADVEPGTILRFGLDELVAKAGQMLSLHELGLLETFMAAGQLGCAPREVVIFGVQPADVAPGLELSGTVARLVPRLVELVLADAGCRTGAVIVGS